jgi:hypothetical protein
MTKGLVPPRVSLWKLQAGGGGGGGGGRGGRANRGGINLRVAYIHSRRYLCADEGCWDGKATVCVCDY